MSFYRQRDSLSWLSLFSIHDEKEKKRVLQWIEEMRLDYSGEWLARKMLDLSHMNYSDYRADDPCMQAACERVALKFILCDSDLAKDLLNAEDLSKANEVYARKQFNSKLLQKLLHQFLKLLAEQRAEPYLNNLFAISIIDEYRAVQEEEAIRTYGPLKKLIESVSSGVKSICYYEADNFFYGNESQLRDDLNAFLVQKCGYDFNKANQRNANNKSSTLFCSQEYTESNRILQLALLNDADFWQAHEKFGVVIFLNKVAEKNDLKHAEKVLTFLLENLRKMPNMELVFSNGFPLWASEYDEMVVRLEDQARRFSFHRLESYCGLSAIQSVPLCYPMCPKDERALEIGKAVWERFLRNYNYPNDYEVVERYLREEVDRFTAGETHDYHDIAVILDSAPFRYSADNEDRRLFAAYHPDCFTSENVWNRVYLKAYAVTLLSADEQQQFSYLQRLFSDIMKTVEKQCGVCTAHQLDHSAREKRYQELKSLLASYGVPVNDSHKQDYVVSLLDRDTALMDEAELFPALEQTGDAIYGLAVAELLFYNPQTEEMPKKLEEYTRAETQVAISKKSGFDKCYLYAGLPAKYNEYDSLFSDIENFSEEQMQTLNHEKYLADSLEMIIGSVCRDAGPELALAFAKALLQKTFPKKFPAEIRPTEENKRNKDIERDYWSKILPSPCTIMDDDVHALWRALDKAIRVTVIGTDDKDKRKFITYSFGNTTVYGEDESYSVTWVFYDYLNNGLSFVLEKYGDRIRENYQNGKNR